MDVRKHYSSLGFEIEVPITEVYENAFKVLKESDDATECLEQLGLIFEAFGESIPSENRLEWTRDLIRGYRTLGRILKKIPSLEYPRIEEILSEYGDLLNQFDDGDDSFKIIKNALKYLKDVEGVLKNYQIGNANELEAALKEKGELEEKLENLEKKLFKLDKFKREDFNP